MLDTILEDIRVGVAAGHTYLAVASALALPDICACLEAESGSTEGHVGKSYRNWVTANAPEVIRSLSVDDLWSLRNGVLHSGRLGHAKMQFERVIFFPVGNAAFVHNGVVNGALMLDAQAFCETMIRAVRAWLQANDEHPHVRANLARVLQHRPNGLRPYVVGLAVVA